MLSFHALNGVAILYISAVLTRRAWRLASGRPATDRVPRSRDAVATEAASHEAVSAEPSSAEAPPRVAGMGGTTGTGTATETPTIVP
jgi:hypothetical protein